MADGSRIPRIYIRFNDYVDVTDDFLQATDPVSGLLNWQRLGLLSAQAAEWHARRGQWDDLWKVYDNKSKCTSVTRLEVKNFMNSFRQFAMPLLNLMVISPQATPKDELIFRFKIKRKKPTRLDQPIAELCEALIDGGTQGRFGFRCRADKQSGRAKKPAGVDSVQLAYRIIASASDVKEGAILNPDALDFVKDIFSTAKFVFEAGAANSGKWILFYTRWFNTKKRHRAGAWGDMQQMVIA